MNNKKICFFVLTYKFVVLVLLLDFDTLNNPEDKAIKKSSFQSDEDPPKHQAAFQQDAHMLNLLTTSQCGSEVLDKASTDQ